MISINTIRKLPDFLIIGAPRSGSTWLYKRLGYHKDIWLTPIKEIHYFDDPTMSLKLGHHRFRRQLIRRLYLMAKKALHLDPAFAREFDWDKHYFLGNRNIDWYAKLFRPEAGQIAGEATPSYGGLDLKSIEEIRNLNPRMKLIYSMRDPIERSWSGATKNLARKTGRQMEIVPEKEISNSLTGPGSVLRSNHAHVLKNWGNVFPAEQILTNFFEDIVQDPKLLLQKIFRFLEVSDAKGNISPDVNQKVNSASIYKSPIPPKFQILLAKLHIDQLRELNNQFDGPVTQWLKRAEKILEDAKE